MEWRERKTPSLVQQILTKVLMPMMEYMEGCMVNDGNYSYMNVQANIWWSGNKMVKELGYFGHGEERLIVANHEAFMVLGFIRKEKECLWIDGYGPLWTKKGSYF